MTDFVFLGYKKIKAVKGLTQTRLSSKWKGLRHFSIVYISDELLKEDQDTINQILSDIEFREVQEDLDKSDLVQKLLKERA